MCNYQVKTHNLQSTRRSGPLIRLDHERALFQLRKKDAVSCFSKAKLGNSVDKTNDQNNSGK